MEVENSMVVDAWWPEEPQPISQCENCECDLYGHDNRYEYDRTIYCEECFIDLMKELYRAEQ